MKILLVLFSVISATAVAQNVPKKFSAGLSIVNLKSREGLKIIVSAEDATLETENSAVSIAEKIKVSVSSETLGRGLAVQGILTSNCKNEKTGQTSIPQVSFVKISELTRSPRLEYEGMGEEKLVTESADKSGHLTCQVDLTVLINGLPQTVDNPSKPDDGTHKFRIGKL